MKTQPQTQTQICALHSASVGEPLYGSAPRTDLWLLLEYPYPAPAKALEESKFPVSVKSHLLELQRSIPALRILLVRRSGSVAIGGRLFLADGRDPQPKMYAFDLQRPYDILSLDIPAIFADGTTAQDHRIHEHLMLVCTNGKRDACCAKWGQPLFKTLSRLNPDWVWQSSHVGGHRFAPNLILLPEGIYFGRIPLSEANRLQADFQLGLMDVQYYRGRAAYPPPAQAGEYFLRLETGEKRLDSYRLTGFSQLETAQWEVRFTEPQEGRSFVLRVAAAHADQTIYESCNTPDDRKPVIAYRLVGSILIQ